MALNLSTRPMLSPLSSPSSHASILSSIWESGGDGGYDSSTIIEMLPSDPFGMDVGSSFAKAFDGLCKSSSVGHSGDYRECTGVNWEFLSEFNYCWDDSGWIPPGNDLMAADIIGLTGHLSRHRGFTSCTNSEDWGANIQVKDQWELGAGYSSQGDDLLFRHGSTSHFQTADRLGGYASAQIENQLDLDVDCIIEGDKLLFVYTRTKKIKAADLLAWDAGSQFNIEVKCSIKDDELLSLDMKTRQDSPIELPDREQVKHVEENLCEEGQPHDGLVFALSYLEIRDLLSVERVCKRLHDEVRNDPLLWRCIHINQPLSEKLTDDALLQLTGRAKGILNCLNLVDCSRITDEGLKHVLESNLRISKLSIPGCVRLTMNGLMSSLQMFKSPRTPGIRYLRIGGMYGVTQAVYEEINLLIGMDDCQKLKVRKPRYYHTGSASFSCDYDSAIDIELCPRCNNWRLIYDCPAESCQGKGTEPCKGCAVCIPRCAHCGRCINDNDYEETFCLDLLCLDCLKNMISCQEKQVEGANVEKILSTSESTCTMASCVAK